MWTNHGGADREWRYSLCGRIIGCWINGEGNVSQQRELMEGILWAGESRIVQEMVYQQLELLEGYIVVVVVVVVVFWMLIRSDGCLCGWEPRKVCADVRLGVGVLNHVWSALLYKWLSMYKPLFNLARASGELCFHSREVVVGADSKGPIRKHSIACAGFAIDSVGVLLPDFVGVEFVAFVAA